MTNDRQPNSFDDSFDGSFFSPDDPETRYPWPPDEVDPDQPDDLRPPVPARCRPFKPPSLAQYPAQAVEWLWPGRIPLGKVTLLVGDPGVGKSLLALDLAARLTASAPWPDGDEDERGRAEGSSNEAEQTPPAPHPSPLLPIRRSSVFILSAEDDLADTIRPRLEAAGGDCRRVRALPRGWSADDPTGMHLMDLGIPDLRPIADRPPVPRPFDLRHDIPILDGMLACCDNCRLVIIDPISAFLGRGVENFNSEVRRLIAPLAELAARRRLAVLAVSHLRKQSGDAIHRTIGSLAFVAAARSTWLVAKDPRDPQRRLMLPVKNNLAASGGSALSFTIAAAGPDQPPTVLWSPEPVDLSADEALRTPRRAALPPSRPCPERDDARRWLERTLAAGAQPSAWVQKGAVAHGMRLVTIRRAFRELGGEAVRVGFGPIGEWFWQLPGVGEQATPSCDDELFGYPGRQSPR